MQSKCGLEGVERRSFGVLGSLEGRFGFKAGLRPRFKTVVVVVLQVDGKSDT